jgi:hypothetical protein
LRVCGESLLRSVERFRQQAETLRETRDLLEEAEELYRHRTTNIRAPCEGRSRIWGILAEDERYRTKDPLAILTIQTGAISLIAYDAGVISS